MIDRRPAGPAVLDGAVVDSGAVLLPWSDPAAQWGFGVFETAAVRDGEPRFLAEHFDRLRAAAERLSVPLPAAAAVEEAAGLVARGVESGHGWLKLLVSRSGRWAAFGGPSNKDEEGSPVAVVTLPWRRHRLDLVTGIKSLAYAGALAGLEEARRRGADEGLWLNERGHLVEACTANVFVVKGRAAVTPALSDGARDGVTRAQAIEGLRALGLSVRQSKVRVIALRGADEIFLTSSLRGVRPVVRLDGRDVRGGRPGPVTKRLAERLAVTGQSVRSGDQKGG